MPWAHAEKWFIHMFHSVASGPTLTLIEMRSQIGVFAGAAGSAEWKGTWPHSLQPGWLPKRVNRRSRHVGPAVRTCRDAVSHSALCGDGTNHSGGRSEIAIGREFGTRVEFRAQVDAFEAGGKLGRRLETEVGWCLSGQPKCPWFRSGDVIEVQLTDKTKLRTRKHTSEALVESVSLHLYIEARGGSGITMHVLSDIYHAHLREIGIWPVKYTARSDEAKDISPTHLRTTRPSEIYSSRLGASEFREGIRVEVGEGNSRTHKWDSPPGESACERALHRRGVGGLSGYI
ncbi:hypothetical protein DFH08DRAFT_941511 [Mycena albidolilacea]|uniref:Uncharacterized protein n=1 Tax=Mycena albidolilacea TaxID=1033008 RepID=A0AAD7EI47_9AGAR|nr:hypothetical protein DFH08DRAFT_941511 [Mycena albidolilacea]